MSGRAGTLFWTLASASSSQRSPLDTLPYGLLAMGSAGVTGLGVWWLTKRLPWDRRAPRCYLVHAIALATYDRGLRLARAQKTSGDPLQPSWGEPELLMSLGWSHLNRTPPDLNAAENYAAATLALVPHWHYVRDILVPQIRSAKEKR